MNSFEDLFDGNRKNFPLTKTVGAAETPLTLRAGKGSPIKVEDNTIIFLNDVLQVPFESYTFKSRIVETIVNGERIYSQGKILSDTIGKKLEFTRG